MMPSSVSDADGDVLDGLTAAATASAAAPSDGDPLESGMDASQVETMFGDELAAATDPLKGEEDGRPQSPMDIEVPFHDDTALEGAVDVGVLVEKQEDENMKKVKDLRTNKGRNKTFLGQA